MMEESLWTLLGPIGSDYYVVQEGNIIELDRKINDLHLNYRVTSIRKNRFAISYFSDDKIQLYKLILENPADGMKSELKLGSIDSERLARKTKSHFGSSPDKIELPVIMSFVWTDARIGLSPSFPGTYTEFIIKFGNFDYSHVEES